MLKNVNQSINQFPLKGNLSILSKTYDGRLLGVKIRLQPNFVADIGVNEVKGQITFFRIKWTFVKTAKNI